MNVKTRAADVRVERVGKGQYKVRVQAAPEKGKANEAVIEALSEHLKVPKSRIAIVGGQTSTQKTVEVR